MKIILLNFGILIVALLIGLKHRSNIDELRSANSQLESKAEAISELKSEITELETLSVDTELLEEYRDETVELMRLRAEAARLRPLANQPRAELEAQIKQIENDLEKAQETLEYETNWGTGHANSSLRDQMSKMISHWTNGYIIQHRQFPDSPEPLGQIFLAFNGLLEGAKQSGEMNAGFENTTIESFELEDYEFFFPPGEMSEWPSDTIVFKERVPLELLNGGWERNYGILETNPRIHNDRPLPFHIVTKTVKLEDGDFEKWEREITEARSN